MTPDWQQRVRDEKRELDGRLERLSNFIEHSEAYNGLSEIEVRLLFIQHLAMVDYSRALARRIALFDLKKEEATA